METLDAALTYLIDIVMALGGGYIGTSLVLYLADRWNELETKPKLQESQKVNIPLTLKAANAVPLELEQEMAMALPVEPLVAPAPERQEVRTVVPDKPEFEVFEAPTLPEPPATPSEATEPETSISETPVLEGSTPQVPESGVAPDSHHSATPESELHNHEDEAGIEAISAELASEEDLDQDIVQEPSD